MRLADLQTLWRHLNVASGGIEMAEIKSEEKISWLERVFDKVGLDTRLFYIAVPRAKGDLIGEPAHLVAALFAIVMDPISNATSSIGIIVLLIATLLRVHALVPSWKQMMAQTWIQLLLVWLIWMALSIAWSPDIPKGIDRWFTFKFFIWLPMLWPLYKQWRWLFAGFLISAFFLQIMQVAGAFGAVQQGETLVRGMRHPTMVGIWDAIALSSWMFLAVTLGWRGMLLCIPMAVLSVIGFVYAGQRGALFGILVEICIANIVLLFAVQGWMRRVLLRFVLSLIVIGGVYFFIGNQLTIKLEQLIKDSRMSLARSGSQDANTSIVLNSSVTYEVRLALWKMSICAWQAHPIIGVGFGGYLIATAPINDVVIPNFNIHNFNQPHSMYVMMLTENGLVGVVLFCFWAGAFFINAFKFVQLDPNRISMFGGAVIWFAAGIGDSFHTRGVFLTVGVIVMAMATMPLPEPINPNDGKL